MRSCMAKVVLDGFSWSFEGIPGEHILKVMQASGTFYERDLLRAIKTLGFRGGVYVDVGAFIGTHTVWFALACGATKVVSIEPLERHFRLLEKNTSLLGLGGKPPNLLGVSKLLLMQAVSDHDGDVEVRLLRRGKPVDTVKCSTLDSLVAKHAVGKVAFVKIDVEGHEQAVLRGAREIIERDRPGLAVEADSSDDQRDVRDWAAQNRYDIAGRYCKTPTFLLVPRRPR